MNNALKLIIMTLLLMSFHNNGFSQKQIELEIDPVNDTLLILSDKGETSRGNVIARKVHWKIKDSNIQSFQIVPKNGTYHPFEINPTQPQSNQVLATVKLFEPPQVWEYKIVWKKRLGKQYTLDPKIAIKPVVGFFIETLLMLGLIISTITSLIFYRNWQTAKTALSRNSSARTRQ